MAPVLQAAPRPCKNARYGCTRPVPPGDRRVSFCSEACRHQHDQRRQASYWKTYQRAEAANAAATVHLPVLTAEETAALEANPMPKTYGECVEAGPCPYVRCRYHLYLDVTKTGHLVLNFPDQEVWELEHTCALDLAGAKKEFHEVAQALGITKTGLQVRLRKAIREVAKYDRKTGHGLRDAHVGLGARGEHALAAAETYAIGPGLNGAIRAINIAYRKLGFAGSFRQPSARAGGKR